VQPRGPAHDAQGGGRIVAHEPHQGLRRRDRI
jgi:hypothetical protein